MVAGVVQEPRPPPRRRAADEPRGRGGVLVAQREEVRRLLDDRGVRVDRAVDLGLHPMATSQQSSSTTVHQASYHSDSAAVFF